MNALTCDINIINDDKNLNDLTPSWGYIYKKFLDETFLASPKIFISYPLSLLAFVLKVGNSIQI